jgi:hypothetical protein
VTRELCYAKVKSGVSSYSRDTNREVGKKIGRWRFSWRPSARAGSGIWPSDQEQIEANFGL